MVDIINIVPVTRAAVYDGTNGADLVAEFAGTVVSDDGTTLVFHAESDPDNPREAAVGQVVMWRASGGPSAVLGVTDGMPPFYAQIPAA